jgi:hypothetical protein
MFLYRRGVFESHLTNLSNNPFNQTKFLETSHRSTCWSGGSGSIVIVIYENGCIKQNCCSRTSKNAMTLSKEIEKFNLRVYHARSILRVPRPVYVVCYHLFFFLTRSSKYMSQGGWQSAVCYNVNIEYLIHGCNDLVLVINIEPRWLMHGISITHLRLHIFEIFMHWQWIYITLCWKGEMSDHTRLLSSLVILVCPTGQNGCPSPCTQEPSRLPAVGHMTSLTPPTGWGWGQRTLNDTCDPAASSVTRGAFLCIGSPIPCTE